MTPLPCKPTSPELIRLLEEAAKRKMTPAERREQAISFVYGQLMGCAPHITREQVARRLHEKWGG